MFNITKINFVCHQDGFDLRGMLIISLGDYLALLRTATRLRQGHSQFRRHRVQTLGYPSLPLSLWSHFRISGITQKDPKGPKFYPKITLLEVLFNRNSLNYPAWPAVWRCRQAAPLSEPAVRPSFQSQHPTPPPPNPPGSCIRFPSARFCRRRSTNRLLRNLFEYIRFPPGRKNWLLFIK